MNRYIQIIEDDHNLAMVLSRVLTKEGYEVAVDHTMAEAKARLENGEAPGLILTDIYLPDGKGLEILEHAKAVRQDISVIVMTANATVESAIEAMKKGAFDYLLKPFRVEELVFTVQRIFQCRDLTTENRFLKDGRKNQFFEAGILGDSVRIREILAIIGLARLAENYKSHGGIHSAAVGDGASILLYAEDLGRHNTLDRIAGEALLKGIDLSGTMLVTSGRVSTELAAKAAMLGISLIASRTSPTDMAVKMCGEAGIALVGYVRGGRFTVYTCPERIACEERLELPAAGRLGNRVIGVVLTDGAPASA
jgi:CheY-like chemotaxis protein